MSERIVKVSLPAWSESAHCWRLLTKRSPNSLGWSGGAWFSKKYCTLVESKHEKNVGILTLPEWLFELKCSENVEFTNLQDKIINT
jgi:hypothetical protein